MASELPRIFAQAVMLGLIEAYAGLSEIDLRDTCCASVYMDYFTYVDVQEDLLTKGLIRYESFEPTVASPEALSKGWFLTDAGLQLLTDLKPSIPQEVLDFVQKASLTRLKSKPMARDAETGDVVLAANPLKTLGLVSAQALGQALPPPDLNAAWIHLTHPLNPPYRLQLSLYLEDPIAQEQLRQAWFAHQGQMGAEILNYCAERLASARLAESMPAPPFKALKSEDDPENSQSFIRADQVAPNQIPLRFEDSTDADEPLNP